MLLPTAASADLLRSADLRWYGAGAARGSVGCAAPELLAARGSVGGAAPELLADVPG